MDETSADSRKEQILADAPLLKLLLSTKYDDDLWLSRLGGWSDRYLADARGKIEEFDENVVVPLVAANLAWSLGAARPAPEGKNDGDEAIQLTKALIALGFELNSRDEIVLFSEDILTALINRGHLPELYASNGYYRLIMSRVVQGPILSGDYLKNYLAKRYGQGETNGPNSSSDGLDVFRDFFNDLDLK